MRGGSNARPVYAIRDLRKRRRGNSAEFELEVPNLVVRTGEVVVLQGVSGSGKSTLLDLLALVLQPDQNRQFRFAPSDELRTEPGQLWKQGARDALARLRGENMGYVSQTGGLLPFLNVQENIELPCRLLGKSTQMLDDLVTRLAISRLLDQYPRQLSVGERQRVAIARALLHQPGVILADEPTASLDPLQAGVVFELLLRLVDRYGTTAIIASHDHQRIAQLGLQPLSHRLEQEGSLTRALFWS